MTTSLHTALFAEPPKPESLWDGQYKIPWDNPEFSARMLTEHLSQDHDLASRKQVSIDRQVTWIHEHIANAQPFRVLDLGCGPGFYISRLCDLGYTCAGIDFSPASIEYAREQIGERATLMQGDIRSIEFPGNNDVVSMIYGELNVFSPEECETLVRKMFESLTPGGTLMFEVHRYEAVKSFGEAPPSWYRAESGLFSDSPHVCLIENHWYESQTTSLSRFAVIETESGEVQSYRSTTRALTDIQYTELLTKAGFAEIEIRDDWPAFTEHLQLLTARKPA